MVPARVLHHEHEELGIWCPLCHAKATAMFVIPGAIVLPDDQLSIGLVNFQRELAIRWAGVGNDGLHMAIGGGVLGGQPAPVG